MIQQALATAGIGNSRSTMVGPNGTVVQAPTQAPMRNDTNAYLPHGQSEVPTLLLSDIHGDLHGEEEEEEGNTGNNEETNSVPSPIFTPHRGQLVVDTQATTPSNLSPIRGIDLSQDSNPVSDGE